jgi:hypothetical protein
MLRWFLLSSLSLFSSLFVVVPAQAILFRAEGSAIEGFQRYALETNQQTYTQWFLQKNADSTAEAHPQVIEFSQRALQEKSAKLFGKDWDRLRTSLDLNRADREVLTLLAEKLRLPQELCRYLTLEPELSELLASASSAAHCQSLSQKNPLNFSHQLDSGELLVIDGKAFTKSQLPSRLLPGSYRWKIISDRYEDRKFTGTAEEFAQQKLTSQSWVRGDCNEYQFAQQDFSLLLQSQLYFGPECVRPAIPKEKTIGDWASEHKALLWGLGILATGFAASQLKDKTLVITKP